MKTLEPKEKKTRRAPPRRAAAKATPKRAAKRTAPPAEEPEVFISGRGLSADEKRRIILAHAAMRETRDPVQIVSMWAGVTATALMVLFGWWWAVKPQIAKNYNNELRPAVSDLGASIKNVTEQMKVAQETLSNTWTVKEAAADTGTAPGTDMPVVDTLQQLMQSQSAAMTQGGEARDIFNKQTDAAAPSSTQDVNNDKNKQ